MIKLEERFNRFYESLLVEDIEAVRKQYPNINDEDFNKLIQLDPTYKGNNSVGKFTKWLLNQFNKGNLKFEGNQLKNGTNSFNNRLYDYLEAQKDTDINKDINSFKNPDELVDAILNSNEKELTDRQIQRRQKKAKDEVDKVFEGENFDIYVPTTYAGSVYIGKGTKWCTAAQSKEGEEHWEEYTKTDTDGGILFDDEPENLYVLINKENPKEKYQFHFESGTYNNNEDYSIDVARFFNENPDVYDFFLSENEKNGYKWDTEFYKFNDILAIIDHDYTWELGSEDVVDNDAYLYVKHVIILETYEPVNGGSIITFDDFSDFDPHNILSIEIPNNFTIEPITLMRFNHLQLVKCEKGSQVEESVKHANEKYKEHKVPHREIKVEYL